MKSWKEKLPELTSGYAKDDIWNMDELVYFGKLCLIMVLVQSQKIVKEGEKVLQ